MSCALLQDIMQGKDPVEVLGISQYILDAALLLGDESECNWLYWQAVAYENGNGGGSGDGGSGDSGSGDGGSGDGGSGDGGPTGPPDYQPPQSSEISSEVIAAAALLYFMFT